MKHIPNILSIARIPLAASLVFLAKYPWVFLCAYVVTGMTDVLDGWLARRYHWETKLGAKIDVFADVFFVLSMLAVVFLVLRIQFAAYVYVAVGVIALVRVANLLFTKIKFGQWATMHSLAIKYASVPVFLVAPICVWADAADSGSAMNAVNVAVLVILFVNLLSVAEEFVIIAKLEEYDMNTKSVYHLRKQKLNAPEEREVSVAP